MLLAADPVAGELVLLPPFALDEVLHSRDDRGLSVTPTSQRPELAAALLMLERMGLSLDDLAGATRAQDAPTFTEFVPKVCRCG